MGHTEVLLLLLLERGTLATAHDRHGLATAGILREAKALARAALGQVVNGPLDVCNTYQSVCARNVLPRRAILADNGLRSMAAVVRVRGDVPSNWEAKAKALNSSRFTVELAPVNLVIIRPRWSR